MFPAAAAPTLRFEPTPYETFDESADLYKDGTVIVVPLRGIRRGAWHFREPLTTRRLFYVGDAVDDERGFEERAAKSLILRDSDNDMALANQDRRHAQRGFTKSGRHLPSFPHMDAARIRDSSERAFELCFRQ